MQKQRPVMLVILDGERREDLTNNAVRQARTPFFNDLWTPARMPSAHLRTERRLAAPQLGSALHSGSLGTNEGAPDIGAGQN